MMLSKTFNKIVLVSSIILLNSCNNLRDNVWNLSTINVEVLDNLTQEKDVICALLDSGITHYYKERINNIMDEINVINEEYETLNKHGSYLATLIADEDYGIDKNIKILPIRIINDAGFVDTKTIIKGLEIAKEYKVDVVNMSFGSKYYSQEIQDLINSFPNTTYFVSSVGDLRQDEYFYPALYDNVLAVSAVDNEWNLYESSNKSQQKKSILAPGVDVLCVNEYDEEIKKTGSSYASAIVSGIIASSIKANKLNKINLNSYNLYTNNILDCRKFVEDGD